MKSFVGRHRELEILDDLWGSQDATMVILSGRRRVGKTRLLTHWLQQHHPDDGMYWMAEPTSAADQLRSFSQAFLGFVDPETPVPPEFTYATWEQALNQLATYAKHRRMSIFLDEVTYVIDVNPNFVGTLQKVWDHRLSNTQVMLALSGSQMGLMRKHLLDYDAPLYGRSTAQMHLPPLPFSTTRQYFPNYSAEERMLLYAIWGGVPAYWERLDPERTVQQNLRRNILPAYAWMVDESRILLQDFITDMHNYVGTLRAIAGGLQTLSVIADRIGIANTKISFYLGKLRDTRFIQRRVPVTKLHTNWRRGRYFIVDPYLRFFYGFISTQQSKLALGQMDYVLDNIMGKMPNFLESYTWPELCRDWLLLAGTKGIVPLPVDEVGSEWKKDTELSVVGVSSETNNLVIGDCFWRETEAGMDELELLVDKAMKIMPNESQTVYYIGFSAGGWTSEALTQAEAVVNKRRRKKWKLAGVRLVGLDEVNADLEQWSVS
ncbi:MAG: ATP-binding protein [Anaerolineales bacterium]|nr:ATP-binding protein [Anaerolineales bacterium]